MTTDFAGPLTRPRLCSIIVNLYPPPYMNYRVRAPARGRISGERKS